MKLFRNVMSTLAVLSALVAGSFAQTPNIANSTPGNNESFAVGKFVANYYGQWSGQVVTGNASTGSQSIVIRAGYTVLPDGRKIVPFAVGVPIVVSDAAPELITPTAVSNCNATSYGVAGGQDQPFVSCTITATFATAHGAYASVMSATNGAAEAQYDAWQWGGGVVVLAPGWRLGLNTSCTACFASQNAVFAALLPLHMVSFEDDQTGVPTYWNLQATASTFLATPTTLTAVTALPSATPVGAYGTGTYHLAIAYVDAAGQVGPESADFSEAGLATGSFIFSSPAASAGAVGYVIYISLTSGTYSLDYQVPLTASICTLTKLETVTPACAVANATYGQSGATATVTAITVNTSPVGMLLGGVSGTLLTGNPNGRTTYSYVPSGHLAANGISTVNLAFTAGGIGSATPIAMGTVNIPAGVLNYVGKALRICGKFINTDVNSTVQNVNIYLDAAGSDVAGSPVQIASLAVTGGTGTATTYTGNFCEVVHTTVAGAGATAGSIAGDWSMFDYYISATPGVAFPTIGGDTKTAAVGSINLAGGGGFENRISVVHTNTTGNATPTLQNLTIEVL